MRYLTIICIVMLLLIMQNQLYRRRKCKHSCLKILFTSPGISSDFVLNKPSSIVLQSWHWGLHQFIIQLAWLDKWDVQLDKSNVNCFVQLIILVFYSNAIWLNTIQIYITTRYFTRITSKEQDLIWILNWIACVQDCMSLKNEENLVHSRERPEKRQYLQIYDCYVTYSSCLTLLNAVFPNTETCV